MPRLLIIAYGNPLRSDDGLAWHVAQRLARLNLSGEVEIITLHQLTPELALRVSQAKTALFIDAAQEGAPGTVGFSPLVPLQLTSTFTHEFSPGAILTLALELYGKCAKAYAISVVGQCFDHGDTLSPKVEESLPQVVARVCEFPEIMVKTQRTSS
jgi:hydrogenase maturation protease